MLPIEDFPQVRERRFPFVMLALLLVNVGIFIYLATLDPAERFSVARTFGLVPATLLAREPLAPDLGINPYLTIITSMFIHAGLLHLVGNMIFLWVFGDNVEMALGHLTFLGVYLASGIVAALSHVAVYPDSTVPLIGASGAIAGVLGGYILLFPQAQVRVLLFFGPFLALGRVTALVIIFGWFVLQVFRGLGAFAPGVAEDGVAYLAHIGGFVAGFALTAGARRVRHEPLGQFGGRVGINWTLRNWLILATVLAGAFALGALIGGLSGAALQTVALGIGALIALGDGIVRATGHRALLGDGQGLGRVLSLFQIVLALLLLGLLAVGL